MIDIMDINRLNLKIHCEGCYGPILFLDLINVPNLTIESNYQFEAKEVLAF